ncbi:MAG: hypothetical protein ACYTBW_00090 [Planctomycetota bacterium]|jgi:hypothetical protein
MHKPYVGKGTKTVLLIGSPDEEMMEEEMMEDDSMDMMSQLASLSDRIKKIEKELNISSDDSDEDDEEYESVMYG